MDMEIVIFVGITGWHQHKCVQQSHNKYNKIGQYELFSVIKYNKDKNKKWK